MPTRKQMGKGASPEQAEASALMVEPARSLAGVVHDPALGHAGQVQSGSPDAGAQIRSSLPFL